MIRVFIGYDERETVAWHVLTRSILARASQPVSFVPLALQNLKSVYWREPNPLQSTDFSFSRFLTPHLSGYEGWSLFMDCDMLVREDITKLWALRDERYAVMCVQHDHQRALTPEYVNTASGLELHQFKWLEGDHMIGALPHGWNHLVGYDKPNAGAQNVHFTIGGPYFEEYADCEHADAWFHERLRLLRVDSRRNTA